MKNQSKQRNLPWSGLGGRWGTNMLDGGTRDETITACADDTVQDKPAAGSLKKELVLVDCMIRRVLRQSYYFK